MAVDESGRTLIQQDPFATGNVVGGYEILGVIGSGAMGTVYKAEQLSLKRIVAIKVLSMQYLRNMEFLKRFKREARALAEISHPNVIAVYDLRVEVSAMGELPYLVTEFVDGESLEDLLKRQGRLPVETVGRYAAHVCQALSQAHGKGIIHRDLKPANILISKEEELKVADFGLAGLIDHGESEAVTSHGQIMGTPAYLSPEQRVDPTNVDARTDLFSLGVVMYRMLVGELPTGHFPSPAMKRPDVPQPLSALVMDLLESDASLRPPSARSALRRLLPELSDDVIGMLGAGRYETSTATVAEVDEPWAYRSFLASFGALIGMYLITVRFLSFRMPDRLLHLIIQAAAISGIIMGWKGIQMIRDSGGKLRGTRFAIFGILGSFWLLWLNFLSANSEIGLGMQLLARLPVATGALSVFALVDWLLRSKDTIGTIFTSRGGGYEKFLWLGVILLPIVLFEPLILYVEPKFEIQAAVARWLSVGIGPMVYIFIVMMGKHKPEPAAAPAHS